MVQIASKIVIAHLSDIHIKDVRRDEYSAVFKLLYQKLGSVNPDVIVISGDVFHDKTKASAYNFSDVENFLSSLIEIAPVVLIPGNHDLNVKVTGSPDLLSPIFKNHSTLREPRFTYWRNSGVYIAHGVSWVVIAPDQDKPSQQEIEDFILKNQMQKAARICLLHEIVSGSLLFNGNLLKSKKVCIEDLVGYDAVLAGDIHLRQSIGRNGRAMYAGSLIQQNLGESYENHGFLLWEVKLSDLCFPYLTTKPRITPFNIYNRKGFLKITIDRGIDKTGFTKPPEPNYYEITYDEETSCESLAGYVKEYSSLYGFPPRAVRLVKSSPASPRIRENTLSSVQEVYNEAQLLVVHEGIITEILGVDNPLLEDILEIHRYHYKQAVVHERGRVRVRLLQLEFSNFYCYGTNNFIDFTKMEGKMSGIVAPNQAGKSSFLDILLFALYEEYPRADRKISIVNNKTSEYYLKLSFQIDGKVGYIEKNGKKSKQLQNSNCRLFYNGENLTKGTSSLTCKEMEKLVGTYANAEFTSFLQQNSKADFVHLRSSERKKTLAELLSFAFFEDLEKEIKGNQGNLNIESRVLEKSFGGVPVEQLEKDYENLIMQFTWKKKALDEIIERLSSKKSSLEHCFLVKEKIVLELSDISQRIAFLESFEKIDSEDINTRLKNLQSITGEVDLSYDEYEKYDIRIPVGFSPNFNSVRVPREDNLAVTFAELQTRKKEKENFTNLNLQLLKKLELKKERLAVLLENLSGELTLNCANINFDPVQLVVEEPSTFFRKEEEIPWNNSKPGSFTREQIDWANSCLSTLQIDKSKLFIEIIQKILLLSNIPRPLGNEEEGEYERLSSRVGVYNKIISHEKKLLFQLTSAKEKYSQTLSEINLWRSILGKNAELLAEDSVFNLDLFKLKESFNDLLTFNGLVKKFENLSKKFIFSSESCENCYQNQIFLGQIIESQQFPRGKEEVGKQIFSFLFYRLCNEELLVIKFEKEIFDVSSAKSNLERFKDLQLQRKALLKYDKLMREKVYWEEKKRAVEILERAAYRWLEDKKLWDSYFFVSSKLPILKNLKKDSDLLDKEIINISKSLHKALDEFEKFSASTGEILLIRKYWLGEVFKYRELSEKAKTYNLSIEETTILKNKFLENEGKLANQILQIDTYQKEIELIQNERSELTGTISVLKDKLFQKKSEIMKETKRSKQLSSKQRELEIMTIYRKIIDPRTGLADKLLRKSASHLQNEVNLVLSECGASFSICFTEDFEVETLVGTGKQLSIIPSKLSSGYQKFVLSLAFRSALWRLSEVTLPDCQFIDEGFGNCDEENLELIIQYINSAATSSLSPGVFFIISHIDTMKNAIQEPLTIEINNSQSCIRN